MSGSFFIVGACWGNTGLVKGGGLWVSKLYLTPGDIMHLRCPMLLRDLGNVYVLTMLLRDLGNVVCSV